MMIKKWIFGEKKMHFAEKVNKSLEIIEKGIQKHGQKIAVCISGGKDSSVIYDLSRKVNPEIDVISVLTPFKPKETFEFMENLKIQNPKIQIFRSDETVSDDFNLFKTDPNECCQKFKVEPLIKALMGYEGWIAGIRSGEGTTRQDYEYIEQKDALFKYNPILHFTETDIWKYIGLYNVPVNELYREGYRSLGCSPCTQIIDDEIEDERQGRWVGTNKQGGECGIHTQSLRK